MQKTINQKILFNFNDTKNIKIGKDVHLSAKPEMDWATESILVAAEETIGVIPFGTHICCINNQYYKFEQIPYGEEGADTINIKCVDKEFI